MAEQQQGRDVVKLEKDAAQPTSAAFAPISSDAQARALLGGAAGGGAPGRLGSIRPKPDLTLGGTQKPKFKPKVPGRRKAKAVKTEGADEEGNKPHGSGGAGGRGRGRGRGNSAFARGRGRRPQPQSQTVFGAGSLVKKGRKTVRPPGSSSGGGSNPKADKAAAERKAEQDRVDAAPVDFGEDYAQSPRATRASKSRASGSATVKREEADDPLLDPESSEDEEFDQYFGAQSAASSARRGQYPPTWLPLSKPTNETVAPPVGAGPDIAGIGAQFGAGASGKLKPRVEIPVSSDFVKLEEASDGIADTLQDSRLLFMQMPSHLPLHHYQPPASMRPGAGDNAASAVDLEAEELRQGGEAAAAARMQEAMSAYESHHKLEPVGAYEKTQALREERKRRELEIVESRKHGVGVDGWAQRKNKPLASGVCAAPGSYLRQPAVPSGKIGKMRIHKSGKVTMLIGDVMYELQRGTPVGFPQLIASYNAPSTSVAHGSAGAEERGAAAASVGAAAAAATARDAGPGSLNILGEVFSKLIMAPSLDHLGLSVEGEGGLAKAREDLQILEEKAAAAAAAEKAAEAEAISGSDEDADDSLEMQATELGMDIDG